MEGRLDVRGSARDLRSDAYAATPKSAAFWREKITAAFDALELAETYGDDGAFLSAARCAADAAKWFREGHDDRAAFINAATIAKATGGA